MCCWSLLHVQGDSLSGYKRREGLRTGGSAAISFCSSNDLLLQLEDLALGRREQPLGALQLSARLVQQQQARQLGLRAGHLVGRAGRACAHLGAHLRSNGPLLSLLTSC